MLHINVNEHLSYEPNTGLFCWLKKRGRKAAGALAGSMDPRGYMTTQIGGKRVYLHRLAVYAMTGKFPEGVVDHINGDKTDNRWSNLRAVSQSENMANRRWKPQTNSKTGLIGASPHASGKFISQIRRNKQHTYLGLYETAEQAHAAYMEAAK